MGNLIFSLNATLPVFLLMVIGVILKKLKVIDESFAKAMNRFVFTFPLPILLFKDLSTVDFRVARDFKFVLFCIIVTIFSIVLAIIISYFMDKESQGEFIQSSYRSSAALLGVALINNIYGQSVVGPLMIIGSVPLYNIIAVIVLSFFKPDTKTIDKTLLIKTLKGIITNPIIIGIIVGLLWSWLQIPIPVIMEKTINSISSTASPLGLIAMGASFNMEDAVGQIKPAMIASFMKLFGFVMLFLPVAILLGFVKEQLVAILIMLGSASTVTCFVMAKNMGHKGILSANVVMITTLLSGFSITFWLFFLKTFQYI